MRRFAEDGVTLLELVIVVLIIALVMTVAYPSLSRGAAAIHLRATGRDVLNVFRYAREKAVTEQVGMKVTVDLENQKLTLTDSIGDGSRPYVMPRDVKIQHMALAGTEVTQGMMVVRFLPNGSSESAEILLKSDYGSTLRIFSDPITGGARIETGSGEDRP
jgi:prepilin-type N-terminal cleavage/methylation domain-containing protein